MTETVEVTYSYNRIRHFDRSVAKWRNLFHKENKLKMDISFVYILTNESKTSLYIGVTNNLSRRLQEHTEGNGGYFTSKYKVHFLVYYEEFTDINLAIEREKQLKKWSRNKKERLIRTMNPYMDFIEIF